MSLRSRRAVAPESRSASITIWPLTMCRPPANRSIEETSALRQHVLVTLVLTSSAFTCAVIAMLPILPCPRTPLPWPARSRGGRTVRGSGPFVTLEPGLTLRRRQCRGIGHCQLGRIVARGPVARRHVGEHQPGAERVRGPAQGV